MEQVQVVTQRTPYSFQDGYHNFPPNKPPQSSEQPWKKNQSTFHWMASFVGLSYMFSYDQEAADRETILHKNTKTKMKRIKRFVKDYYIYMMILFGVFVLYFFRDTNSSMCIPRGNTICLISDDGSKYANVLSVTNEKKYHYDDTATTNYRNYCKSVEPMTHSVLSVWEINGSVRYFRKSDEHPTKGNDTDSNDIIQSDKFGWIDSISSLFANGKEVNRELDTVCTFEEKHPEYVAWVTRMRTSSSEFFGLSHAELNGRYIHSVMFNKEGIWDISKTTLLNKMRMTIDSGESNCTCAHEHGFYKNIIAYLDKNDKSTKIMYNSVIESRSVDTIGYEKTSTEGLLATLLRTRVIISLPSSVKVKYINDYNRQDEITMTREDAICVLFCTSDPIIFS